MDPRYIHGTKPSEQRRLTSMNDLLNTVSLDLMRLSRGEKILDLGCGLGQLSRAMARVTGVRVVGVERSPEQIAEAERQARDADETDLVEFRKGDVLSLPLDEGEWGSFDLAHTRFLLEHLPDPGVVVASMVKAVRPGGRIILEDDDHANLRLWPESSAFDRLWDAYVEGFRKLGNDPFVGRRLTGLLHEAGATPVSNQTLSVSRCSGDPKFEDMVAILRNLMTGARSSMTSPGGLEETQFEEGMKAIETWSSRPDAALWYATCWAEGKRPE